MILLDSNILIYSSQTEYIYLKPLVLNTKNYVSHISKLEVLGFPRLTQNEKQYFENVFKILIPIPINETIIDKAIELRQQFKMKSNDSIIAATALLHEMDVYTRNVDDFKISQVCKLLILLIKGALHSSHPANTRIEIIHC